MSLRCITLILFVTITSSCSDLINQSTQESLPDKTIFIPFTQTDTLSVRAKGTQNQSAASPPSEFGCSLSTLNESGADQLYRYQAFYIRFPKNVIDEAAGKVTRRAFTLRSNRAEDRTPEFLNRDGVVRYLTCRIPDARQAVAILEKEMQKFGGQSWYNDLDPPENAKVKSGSGYNSMSGDYVYTCQYEPGDGYGNTSSTITIDGVTYTTYYFQEECGYEYVEDGGDEGPETPTEDPFGGGGGGTGDPGDPNSDPDPCSSVEDGVAFPMDSSGEVIGCGSGVPAYVISISPEVKYPEGSNYATTYPKLTEYLRNKLPTIGENSHIVDAILAYTDLSRQEVIDQLKWGQGPTVEIVQLENACASCDESTIGLFDPDTPNTLKLDVDMVNTMEATTPGSLVGDSYIFWIGTTILHEFVHYGDAIDGHIYPGEAGDAFETDAYGQDVTISNALEVLLNNTDY